MGGPAQLQTEPLLSVLGVGPSGLDANLQGGGGGGGRMSQGGLLFTDGLKLPDELQVQDGAPIDGALIGSDARRGVPSFKAGAEPVGFRLLAAWKVVHTCIALGAEVERVGSGVGDSKHSIGVVGGVRGHQRWPELGFDVISQLEKFILMDVLGEGLVWHRWAKVDGGLLAEVHAKGDAEPQVFGRR